VEQYIELLMRVKDSGHFFKGKASFALEKLVLLLAPPNLHSSIILQFKCKCNIMNSPIAAG